MTPGPTRNPRACPRRGRVNETSRGCWPRTKYTHGSGFRNRLSVLAEHLIFGAQLPWVPAGCISPASLVGCSSFPSVPLPCGMVGVSPARPYVEFFFVYVFVCARGFALFLLDRLQIGEGGRMGPSGLVEAVAVKAAEGMKVVVVQG